MNLLLLVPEDFARGPDGATAARACDLGDEFRIELRGRRHRHVLEVHRARVGRELAVGRLDGRIGRGIVETLDDERLVLRARLDQPPPPKLPVTLLLALPRPKTLRRVLQTCATMGVARLLLVNSWRVDKSFWKSPQLETAAIQRELLLGLEQGRDTIAPIVESKRLLRPFVERELDALAAESLRLLAHPAASASCPRDVQRAVTLALGPEGGFIERELDLFARHGFQAITLGSRPLRVEQAVPALLARIF